MKFICLYFFLAIYCFSFSQENELFAPLGFRTCGMLLDEENYEKYPNGQPFEVYRTNEFGIIDSCTMFYEDGKIAIRARIYPCFYDTILDSFEGRSFLNSIYFPSYLMKSYYKNGVMRSHEVYLRKDYRQQLFYDQKGNLLVNNLSLLNDTIEGTSYVYSDSGTLVLDYFSQGIKRERWYLTPNTLEVKQIEVYLNGTINRLVNRKKIRKQIGKRRTVVFEYNTYITNIGT